MEKERISDEKLAKVNGGSAYTYTVAAGDTLLSIAEDYRTTVEQLMKWNGLHNDVITVGQRLTIKF